MEPYVVVAKHLVDQRIRDLVRLGMDPDEAVDMVKQDITNIRLLRWYSGINGFLLDLCMLEAQNRGHLF